MEQFSTEVLVVGGGTGGTAAAIQAARQGVQVTLVSESPWLGGMLTAAGVAAPDGNELLPFQTGLWGAFLRELDRRQPGGLHHGWVSFFTYEPATGAAIFRDWAEALPNLHWRWGHRPRELLRDGSRVAGAVFDRFAVKADVTVDGTELGDLLALGEIPYRWGWEPYDRWHEPSAPRSLSDPQDPLHPIVQTYPVQSPTWVVVMQDYGSERVAPPIPEAAQRSIFEGAWTGYSPQEFLNYGRLPGNRFMINWPQQGNDYGIDLERLIESEAAKLEFWREAQHHSQLFAGHIQATLGRRYGLASDTFPKLSTTPGGGAYALYPYYRESRRLVGLTTICENDILPAAGGQVAALPVNDEGVVDAIAIGNYPNDHHYPGFEMPLAPKAIRWGGRWTGTPFTIPYRSLIPADFDGLLVCDKNISVSHMANGATRLQPVVLSIGQAAGAAAALCVRQRCSPRELGVQALQHQLLHDPIAPAAVVPTFDLVPGDASWQQQQKQYLSRPDTYPPSGKSGSVLGQNHCHRWDSKASHYQGICQRQDDGSYRFTCLLNTTKESVKLVSISPFITHQLEQLPDSCDLSVSGIHNLGGSWILVQKIDLLPPLS